MQRYFAVCVGISRRRHRVLSLMNCSVCLSSLSCVFSLCWPLSVLGCHTAGNKVSKNNMVSKRLVVGCVNSHMPDSRKAGQYRFGHLCNLLASVTQPCFSCYVGFWWNRGICHFTSQGHSFPVIDLLDHPVLWLVERGWQSITISCSNIPASASQPVPPKYRFHAEQMG